MSDERIEAAITALEDDEDRGLAIFLALEALRAPLPLHPVAEAPEGERVLWRYSGIWHLGSRRGSMVVDGSMGLHPLTPLAHFEGWRAIPEVTDER